MSYPNDPGETEPGETGGIADPEGIPAAPGADAPAAGSARAVWWRRRPVLIGAAVLVVAAGTAVTLAATSSPGTIQIHGVLALGPLDAVDTTTGTPVDGDACSATGGYDDITAGAAVVVGDGQGQTIGTGGLQAGIEGNVDDSAGVPLGNCSFQFAVTVPAGESTYTVTISHRGTQTLTPEQVKGGILLTLDAS